MVQWVAVFVLLIGQAHRTFAATPTEIDTAIDRAKEWLLVHQRIDGGWEPAGTFALPPHARQNTGVTALVTYALLCSGVSPGDAAVSKAITNISQATTDGGYALGMRCLLWGSIKLDDKLRSLAIRDTKQLLASVRREGPARGLFYYTPVGPKDLPTLYDHSVSQLAALGLGTIEDNGVEIPSAFWKWTDQAWRAHQYPSGAWSYINEAGPYSQETPAMTAAGVATLFLTNDRLQSSVACKGNVQDPNIAMGIEWLSTHFDLVTAARGQILGQATQRYCLFGISRIGVASGFRLFKNIDWYAQGAEYLVRTQAPDGSYIGQGPQPAEIALAVLFLTYGRAPLVVQKLEYTGEGQSKPYNWNQRPRDMANFTAWMGEQTEKRLNWEIVNLDIAPEDLHGGPLLYMSGDQPFTLSQADQKSLQTYIQQGGMIVGNADCNSIGFSQNFKKLGTQMFPSYEFRELPANHAIFARQLFNANKWKVKPRVLALSNGVRELMILPSIDMSKAFQQHDAKSKAESYDLMANIVSYGMDKNGLRPHRGTYWVKNGPTTAPATVLANGPETRTASKPSTKLATVDGTVARLKYSGNWDPEPGGWIRLAAIVHREANLQLQTVAVPLGEGKLKDYKFAHLTGTTAIKLTPAQRDEIQKFADAGGTLLVDSAGGSAEFATSIEGELNQIFPTGAQDGGAILPIDDPLYRLKGFTIESAFYRTFARHNGLGNLRVPHLKAIAVNKRNAVFYSREDLSAGLVGQPIDGIFGYDPISATPIVRNVILWASTPTK